ncbi:MAG: site-2 protease family protein [Thermoguttaceae bacterium]
MSPEAPAAELAPVSETSAPPRRHVALPLLLFILTCLSTFWVGSVAWRPVGHLGPLYHSVLSFVENLSQGSPWAAMQESLAVADMDCRQGLLYMAAVLGILLSHEMGHFLMASRHRIPASLPYFIPVPILPFGTLGAVIGMEGFRANRRELFDLGVAGPLAGLIVALPITWLGIRMLPTAPMAGNGLCFHNPLLLQSMIAWLQPAYPTPNVLYLNQLNPFLMAGWMGMLVTGLNLLPISQLDGGHVAHALLGDHAKYLARGLLLAGIAFILVTEQYGWTIMLVLVTLLGADHPPTADDRCPLGLFRRAIGWASLLIPILCFPSMGITPT